LETYLHEVVLASFPVLAYDENAAHRHGLERARLDALGRPAPYVDGQIAAIASVNDLVLVTANVRDFARFKGLAVENWSKR
jgi:tRNA(fMet)-specific endonuclease VapC